MILELKMLICQDTSKELVVQGQTQYKYKDHVVKVLVSLLWPVRSYNIFSF